jgi:meiotically up-regulated gene 157 (Mug157) protein
MGFISKHNPLYQRTRAYVLSMSNEDFYRGQIGDGVGSCTHTGADYIWPISKVQF